MGDAQKGAKTVFMVLSIVNRKMREQESLGDLVKLLVSRYVKFLNAFDMTSLTPY